MSARGSIATLEAVTARKCIKTLRFFFRSHYTYKIVNPRHFECFYSSLQETGISVKGRPSNYHKNFEVLPALNGQFLKAFFKFRYFGSFGFFFNSSDVAKPPVCLC